MLKVIKKTRIHEEVFSQIHELIKQGRLKARDQLPSERELAETFKVSRTSVREALRTLESQGLIVSKTGMGNFVVDLPVEALVGPLAPMLVDEKTALADVFSSISISASGPTRGSTGRSTNAVDPDRAH